MLKIVLLFLKECKYKKGCWHEIYTKFNELEYKSWYKPVNMLISINAMNIYMYTYIYVNIYTKLLIEQVTNFLFMRKSLNNCMRLKK